MSQHLRLFKEKIALQSGSLSFHQTHIWTLSQMSKTTKKKALLINLNNKLQKSPWKSLRKPKQSWDELESIFEKMLFPQITKKYYLLNMRVCKGRRIGNSHWIQQFWCGRYLKMQRAVRQNSQV